MSGQLEFGEEDRSAALRRAWELSLHLLATKVSTVAFETYLRTLQPLSYNGNIVTFGIASSYARERLEKNHSNSIRSALEFHLDTTGLQLQFVVVGREQRPAEPASPARKPDPAVSAAEALQPALPLETGLEDDQIIQAGATSSSEAYSVSAATGGSAAPPTLTRSSARINKPSATTRTNGARKVEAKPAPEPTAIPSLPLIDRYSFDNFLVGRSNRLAHAGATGVASQPGTTYNPLFLYGGPGLGKTHLLQGIAHSLRKADASLRIAYVSGEYFAQHYITALREHATENFRRQYREVDVWLVDDVQFIAGKEHTKEEFFHTFNSLYQSGKQIVIASDRSPRELNTMDERLRSRFQSGLIADIGAPELETRIAILQQCRQREQYAVSDDVLDYIASAIQSNIRALEGALTKLIAYSSIHNAPATAELAQGVLSEYFIEKPIRYRRITIDEIIEMVAAQFGTTSIAIKGPNRTKDVSLARQVAMYISRELLSEINTTITGAAFGGRDHATAIYACQRIRALMELDVELKTLVVQMMRRLGT